MPSMTYLTVALALSSAVIASPVKIDKRSSFTVEQVARGKFLKNVPALKAQALQKYGHVVSQSLLEAAAVKAASAAADDEGSDPANPSNQYDESYLSPVTVGSSSFNLDFDTGSSDLWVFSSLLPKADLTGHDYYVVNPSKLKSGYTWKITYGDSSSASGKVYSDSVVIGSVTATSQAVEAAATVSSSFVSDIGTDGLVGLGFSSNNAVSPTQQTTFFDTVKDQLASPLFAVNLKYHAAGSYDFGFIDSSKYTGDITYVDVDSSNGWWQINVDGYVIGSDSTDDSFTGILDTGTTLLLLPDDVVDNYYASVSGAAVSSSSGLYEFPCSASLPDFALTIGGVAQTIPGEYINYAPDSGDSCIGGIQYNDGVTDSSGNSLSIFGDIFLKSKYVILENNGSPRAGIAQQA